MHDIRVNRFLNYSIALGLVFFVYLISTIGKNVEANPINSEAQISILDVGQADSSLINLPNSTQVLIDAGKDGSVLNKISSRMPKFDKTIEYVFLTHPDQDHIGGMEAVLQNYNVKEIYQTDFKSESKTYERLQNKIDEKKIEKKKAKKGEKVKILDGVSADILSPSEKIDNLSSNNSSIVIMFSYKSARAMFMGDAEIESQNEILKNNTDEILKSDLLKVSHHGSANGMNKKLIEAVKPRYAVISVGKNNKYGHPAKSVIENFALMKIETLRTDELSTIDFVSNGLEFSRN